LKELIEILNCTDKSTNLPIDMESVIFSDHVKKQDYSDNSKENIFLNENSNK